MDKYSQLACRTRLFTIKHVFLPTAFYVIPLVIAGIGEGVVWSNQPVRVSSVNNNQEERGFSSFRINYPKQKICCARLLVAIAFMWGLQWLFF